MKLPKNWKWDVTILSVTKKKIILPRRLVLTDTWALPGDQIYVIKTWARLNGWADVFAWLGGGMRSETQRIYARTKEEIVPALEKRYGGNSRDGRSPNEEMIEVVE